MKHAYVLIYGLVSAVMQKLAADLRAKSPSAEIGLRNPDLFRTSEIERVGEVHIFGDYPDIVAAYEANDIKVVKHAAPKEKAEKTTDAPPAKLEADLTHMPTKEAQLAFLAQQNVTVPKNASAQKIVDLVAETQTKIAEAGENAE